MKTTKILMLILAIAVLLYILIPRLSWAEDGTAQSKMNCHNAAGTIAGSALWLN